MGKGKGKGPMGVPMSSEGDNVMDKDQVINVVDHIINEFEEGEPNDLKNEPSQDPEEQLDRVEDDLGGAEGEDYEAAGDIEVDEMIQFMNTMVDSTLLEQDSAYQTYFRSVMKKHNIKGIRGLSSEKRSAFFKDVSAGWKKHKKVKEAEDFLDPKLRIGKNKKAEDFLDPKLRIGKNKKAEDFLDPKLRIGKNKKAEDFLDPKLRLKKEQEEYAKYFNYLAELCGIDDMSLLEDEEVAEFYGLVHEAYEVGTGLTELMQKPGAPISNPMSTYGNTIDKMKNQLRPERREKQMAAVRAATLRKSQ